MPASSNPTPAASDESWMVVRGSSGALPLILRMRRSIPAGVHPPEYPFQVTIRWAYPDHSNNGLPPPPVLERMNQLEDRLETIEGPQNGYMLLSMTGEQRKEWSWYVQDKAKFIQALNQALRDCERFPIEILMAEDPHWSAYMELLAEILKSNTG